MGMLYTSSPQAYADQKLFLPILEDAMRLTALLILPLVLVAANGAQDDADNKELKKLEGSWLLVSGESKGEALPEKILKNAKLTIVGDKHTVELGEDTIVGTHRLDATKKPKEIDATDTEGPFKGKKMLGIYKLEKDQFTVCFAAPDKDRPTEFTTKSGTGTLLHAWKRAKK